MLVDGDWRCSRVARARQLAVFAKISDRMRRDATAVRYRLTLARIRAQHELHTLLLSLACFPAAETFTLEAAETRRDAMRRIGDARLSRATARRYRSARRSSYRHGDRSGFISRSIFPNLPEREIKSSRILLICAGVPHV